jgi:hypothetical protein
MSGEDRAQITGVINLYALAVDSTQWPLFEKVFTPDVEVRTPNGTWSGREPLSRHWAAFHDPLDGSTHTFTNHQVLVRGDRANALSYVIVRLMRAVGRGDGWYEAAGWYDDTLERTADGWRISSRNYGTNWWRGDPRVGGEGFAPDQTLLRHAAARGEIRYLKALAEG